MYKHLIIKNICRVTKELFKRTIVFFLQNLTLIRKLQKLIFC